MIQPPPPPVEQEPELEPSPEIENPEEPAAPSCPPPRRANRSETRPPTPAPEPPPEPQEQELEEPLQEESTPSPQAVPHGVGPELQAAAPIPAGAPRSGSGEQPAGPSSGGSGNGRTAAEPDPCESIAASLRSRIEAIKTYPRWAEAMNITGTVRLSMRIGQDGSPRGVRVVGTSGHSRLDRHAQDIARRVAGLPSDCRRPISIPLRFNVVRSRR